jgi:hypothetical protein
MSIITEDKILVKEPATFKQIRLIKSIFSKWYFKKNNASQFNCHKTLASYLASYHNSYCETTISNEDALSFLNAFEADYQYMTTTSESILTKEIISSYISNELWKYR